MNTFPEDPQQPRMLPWSWIIGGFVALFVVGLSIGVALFLVSQRTAPEPTLVPASPLPPATSPPETAEQPGADPTQAAVEDTKPRPSSIGMVAVPEGTYLVANRVANVGDFWIDQFEVANVDYAEYLAATLRPAPAYWASEDIPVQMGTHPVRNVTWDEAQAYCEWAGKRLPTETEWEVAARGPGGSLYPWGDEPGAVPLPLSGTHAVGSYPANRSFFGAYDMAGNVWEWVTEPYFVTAEGARVLRGGANNFPNDMLERLAGDPTSSAMISDAGFRCAADEVELHSSPLLIFSDDFADIQSGWSQARAPVDNYFYGYHPTDFYHVQVSAPDECLVVRHELALDDFVAEVEVFQAKTDTESGEYRDGLMVREEAGDYYALLVSPRGQSWRVVRGSPAGTAIVGEGADESIGGLTRDTRDKLTVIASGPELFFFVNGRLVSTVLDEESVRGNLGFVVETLDETYAHIHFDQIVVSQMPANAVSPSAAPVATRPVSRPTEPPCSGSVGGDDLLHQFATYTVQEGDTLSQIAGVYGVSVEEIQGANGRRVQDPNVITVGQVLIIPAS